MINLKLPFHALRSRQSLSERRVVVAAAISRGAIRNLEAPERSNLTVGVIHQLASFYNRDLEVIISARDTHSECSTVAIAYKIERDGFDSWKIHLFDLVDEFRRTLDGIAQIVMMSNSSSSILALNHHMKSLKLSKDIIRIT